MEILDLSLDVGLFLADLSPLPYINELSCEEGVRSVRSCVRTCVLKFVQAVHLFNLSFEKKRTDARFFQQTILWTMVSYS